MLKIATSSGECGIKSRIMSSSPAEDRGSGKLNAEPKNLQELYYRRERRRYLGYRIPSDSTGSQIGMAIPPPLVMFVRTAFPSA